MGVCSRKPLAKGKGVHREVEPEENQRQTFVSRNTAKNKYLKFIKASLLACIIHAFTSGHLLRCESLEIEYYVGDFRRLASDLN